MSDQFINLQRKVSYDTAHNWYINNPILLQGEIGIETTTQKLKSGDGKTRWNNLPYVQDDNHRGATFYRGDAITGTPTVPTAFPTNIIGAIVGDIYIYTGEDENNKGNEYICTHTGDMTQALWVYARNNRGPIGPTGRDGGTTIYSGLAITGTSTTPAHYATGIATVKLHDEYWYNGSDVANRGNVYKCVLDGNPSTALWVYDRNGLGATGAQGPAGPASYVHIRWGNTNTPSPLLTSPAPYVGIAVTTSATAPTSYTSYTWYLYKGETGSQGPQGAQGPAGPQGPTGEAGVAGANAYVHIKWGTSATPATLLTTPADYIGIVSSNSPTAPTTYSGYTWFQYKGNVGAAGARGATNYHGSAITGTSTTPTAYATGITSAIAEDRYYYEGSSEDQRGNVYRCTLGGNEATALWVYVGTSKGPAGGSLGDITNASQLPTTTVGMSTQTMLDNHASILSNIASGVGVTKQSPGIHVIKSGNTFQVRTSWDTSVDMVTNAFVSSGENNIFNFDTLFTISNATDINTLCLIANGTLFKNAQDDSCPIYLNSSYLGGNHGFNAGRVITLANHGKTEADIGSVWTGAEGGDWIILKILTTNTILICSEYTGNTISPLLTTVPTAPLNHKSGAAHTSSMTFSSISALTMITPSINNRAVKILIDGKYNRNIDVGTNFSEYGKFVDVAESYNIIDVPAMLIYLKSHVGSNTNTSVSANAIGAYCRRNIVYRFQDRGVCVVYESTDFFSAPNVGIYGVVQSMTIGSNLLVPGTIYDSVTLQSSTSLYFREGSNEWRTPLQPPNRYYQFDSGLTKGFVCGYCPVTGYGIPTNRYAVMGTGKNAGYYQGSSKKVYPHVYAVSYAVANSTYEVIGYRVPIQCYKNTSLLSTSWYWVGDDAYLMIENTSGALGATKVSLPDYMNGMKVSVVEKTASMSTPASIISAGILSLTFSGVGSAILKLSPYNVLDVKTATELPTSTTGMNTQNALDYIGMNLFANLIPNGNFTSTAGWSAAGATQTVGADGLTLSGNGTTAPSTSYSNIFMNSTHKYYIASKVRATNSLCTLIRVGNNFSSGGYANISKPVENRWYKISVVASGAPNNLCYLRPFYDISSLGSSIQIKYVFAIDLTEKFGSGNEPTVAQMDEYLAAWESIYFTGTENVTKANQILLSLFRLKSQIDDKGISGVISGLEVLPQVDPNLTVKVNSGVCYRPSGFKLTPDAAVSLSVTAPHSTYNRYDIIYVDMYGVTSYLAGTAAATPVVPAVPTEGTLLATISVTPGLTGITSANITPVLRGNGQKRFDDLVQRIVTLEINSAIWNSVLTLEGQAWEV